MRSGNGNNVNSGDGTNGNDGTTSSNENTVDKINRTKANTSEEINLNCEKDELVLDVLNDDLIAKVRGRITCRFL